MMRSTSFPDKLLKGAAAVVFWLLANELISILENVADIGVPMPAFLMKAVELVKEKAEYSMQSDKEV